MNLMTVFFLQAPPAAGDSGSLRVLRCQPLRTALRRVPCHDRLGRTGACGGAGGCGHTRHCGGKDYRGQRPDPEKRRGDPLSGQAPEGRDIQNRALDS